MIPVIAESLVDEYPGTAGLPFSLSRSTWEGLRPLATLLLRAESVALSPKIEHEEACSEGVRARS